MSDDKVPQVRMEFAKSLSEVKPFIEDGVLEGKEIKYELIEKIEKLKADEDADVAEATDDMDFELLQKRKIQADKYLQLSKQSAIREKLLIERNVKE